jgi:hypothetical protein
MTLSHTQLAQMASDGYLLLPALFDADEVELLRAAVPEVIVRKGPEVIGEDGDPSVARMIFAAHAFNETVRRLTLHPRRAAVRRAGVSLPDALQREVELPFRRLGVASGLQSMASPRRNADAERDGARRVPR